ncbi:MAG: ATP-grasp domain-containing protein [Chloroflexota bacterium]
MTHKRIMLLTTSRSYRNTAFMQAAQRLGIEVLQVVNMQTELADYWNHPLGVNFGAPDEAAQEIAVFARKNPVLAIRAVDDSGTLVAAKASALLGLPQNDPVAAEAARNKLQMRTLFTQAGVRCPWFKLFSTKESPKQVAEQVTFPCVVKPLNLSGSRGVIRANDSFEFTQAISRLVQILAQDEPNQLYYSYLVESYIDGGEVALEGMLDGGNLTVLALFDKPDPLIGPFFEETIYVTPSRLSKETQDAIAECAAQSAAALGLREGPVHAEFRINEQGPWILEIAGRSIGGLCSQTLRFGQDLSLEELILRQACGLPFVEVTDVNVTDENLVEPGQDNDSKEASGVMMIPIPQAGILKQIDGVEEARGVSGIDDIQMTAKLNYSLIPLPEGDSYLGFIFASGQTPDEVEEALRCAHEKLRFEILPELALELRM